MQYIKYSSRENMVSVRIKHHNINYRISMLLNYMNIQSWFTFSPRTTTSTLATCLLGRNEADVYALSLPEYHILFRVNIILIVEEKITIEIEKHTFRSLLATDNLVLRQVWNRTVTDVVARYQWWRRLFRFRRRSDTSEMVGQLIILHEQQWH